VKSIVIARIASGIAFAHESDIIHRDFKSSHILLYENHGPRICDFGLVRDQSVVTTITGKVNPRIYTAPEFYDETDCDEKADVLSFWLILCEIVVGQPAFSPELSMIRLVAKVAKGERAEIPATVERFVAGLIRRGWSSNPAVRPLFREIFEELRRQVVCVARDGFDRAAVESYVRWIGAKLPVTDSAGLASAGSCNDSLAPPPEPRAAQARSDLVLDLSLHEDIMAIGAGATGEVGLLRGPTVPSSP
jgi:serine/threonine protein kinase